ncbi:MAG: TIGR00282 family metallophosphoesterase [Nitrospinae bacterium]|nr:TIGR00282 family metallophosphoesterase [Nitrospinota bacterium]
MKVLLVGDIVGKVGRRVLSNVLFKIIDQMKIDFSIANCENAAGGFGVTRETADEIFRCGIDVLTSGNHIWDKKETLQFINDDKRILRPANYPEGAPGSGCGIFETNKGMKIAVLNLSGRVFMDSLDCPFKVADREIAKLKSIPSASSGKQDDIRIIIVDMHAEATSEKIAMGWYLDGKVSAVIGTHTHVQTADEKILPRSTAYLTDAGMTGPSNSVIGIKKELALQKFITKIPKKFEMAGGEGQFNGVIVDIDEDSGMAKGIKRLQLTG